MNAAIEWSDRPTGGRRNFGLTIRMYATNWRRLWMLTEIGQRLSANCAGFWNVLPTMQREMPFAVLPKPRSVDGAPGHERRYRTVGSTSRCALPAEA